LENVGGRKTNEYMHLSTTKNSREGKSVDDTQGVRLQQIAKVDELF